MRIFSFWHSTPFSLLSFLLLLSFSLCISSSEASEECSSIDVEPHCITNTNCSWCVPLSAKKSSNATDACHLIDECERDRICLPYASPSDCADHDCTWCRYGGPSNGLSYCKGNDGACPGCDGLPGSGKILDVCGVCGGTNTTCFHLRSKEVTGVLLSLMGNMLISFSLNAQKHAHNLNQRALDRGVEEQSYMRSKVWWMGIVMMACGESGNFLAYAYAPATLVAPLGAVTVVSNSLIAHFLLKEPWSARNIAGCASAVIGAVLIVRFAPASDEQLTMELLVSYCSEPGFIVYFIALMIMLLSLLLSPQRIKEKHLMVYIMICSITGSVTVMSTKGVATAFVLTLAGDNQFTHVLPWLLVVLVGGTIVLQVKYLNMAMKHFGTSEVVPVFYVMFTLCSILSGIVLFKEFHEDAPGHTLYFVTGCFMTFLGVHLITSASKQRASESNGSDRMVSMSGGETAMLLGGDTDFDDDFPVGPSVDDPGSPHSPSAVL